MLVEFKVAGSNPGVVHFFFLPHFFFSFPFFLFPFFLPWFLFSPSPFHYPLQARSATSMLKHFSSLHCSSIVSLAITVSHVVLYKTHQDRLECICSGCGLV